MGSLDKLKTISCMCYNEANTFAYLCFQQATFKVKLDVPSELTALSNMPIIDEKLNENFKTVSFKESPVMSTYLVALVVGLFDHIEDTSTDGMCTNHRIYAFV